MTCSLRQLLRSRLLIGMSWCAWLMLVVSSLPAVSEAMMGMAPAASVSATAPLQASGQGIPVSREHAVRMAMPMMNMPPATSREVSQSGRLYGDAPPSREQPPHDRMGQPCVGSTADGCTGMKGHACHCAAMSGNGVLPSTFASIPSNAISSSYAQQPVPGLSPRYVPPLLRPPLLG